MVRALFNKESERELELKVAVTGVNDPEKPPDRIRQFGLQRRKEASVETDFPLSSVNVKTVVDKATPAPELPRVAFQSPILDYSSALGLSGAGLYQRPIDTTRLSVYPPQPSSTLSDVYRSPPYDLPPPHHHHHYYSRNPLEPPTPYYNHLAVPAGVHVPYWNLPPGGVVSSHYGNHSPHSQRSESSFPEPQPHPVEVATADSRVAQFPPEKSRTARERILSYRDALKKQREKERRVEEQMFLNEPKSRSDQESHAAAEPRVRHP
ncbi:hypothetical protein WMY93_010420 [Mugilogobius chulae]|uniref:Uncharacterized protein n=1 Tax=Mugilogobius chulae TaxID=88201 RepID=A0AAW0PIR2_9GOBI